MEMRDPKVHLTKYAWPKQSHVLTIGPETLELDAFYKGTKI